MKNQLREIESRAKPISCLERSSISENQFHDGKKMFIVGLGKLALLSTVGSKAVFHTDIKVKSRP